MLLIRCPYCDREQKATDGEPCAPVLPRMSANERRASITQLRRKKGKKDKNLDLQKLIYYEGYDEFMQKRIQHA